MKREELISKWLNNDLNDQEFEAFKALEDYDELVKLDNSLQGFKVDTYDTSSELEGVLSKIRATETQKTAPKLGMFKTFLRVAAVIAICVSAYYYTTTLDTTVTTQFAQKATVELPDASTVSLNAKSVLAYNKNHWNKERDVELQGEAFFKVAKGSTFNVNTTSGTVTVYGTQFNVKQRDNYFEVICYEGLVGVTYNAQETKLKPGDSFLIIDGKKIAKEKDYRSSPSWLNNESEFKSIPFKQVVAEFERQYEVDITLVGVDSTKLFTGSFTHDNLDVALKSIALPLQVSYSKKDGTIILKRE
ncbi:FecR domain-containing protein [Hyunsoonleella sp. SJ7]|uniref:FecR domain-containing protein n=1 Tax=Hyunsoonleella aquatilis TaxID=2762758 RepID=A0A923KLA6_9FLAO|nr:FecR domain-containing protein [Hyunsoonleella aquatilis]MBC3759307.1 FecR domain-containing protein [Hyunsoonleella aquatilis]